MQVAPFEHCCVHMCTSKYKNSNIAQYRGQENKQRQLINISLIMCELLRHSRLCNNIHVNAFKNIIEPMDVCNPMTNVHSYYIAWQWIPSGLAWVHCSFNYIFPTKSCWINTMNTNQSYDDSVHQQFRFINVSVLTTQSFRLYVCLCYKKNAF